VTQRPAGWTIRPGRTYVPAPGRLRWAFARLRGNRDMAAYAMRLHSQREARRAHGFRRTARAWLTQPWGRPTTRGGVISQLLFVGAYVAVVNIPGAVRATDRIPFWAVVAGALAVPAVMIAARAAGRARRSWRSR
jgi:hypothetical protein